jgi:transcriptional regulator with XRE-family HTH domain
MAFQDKLLQLRSRRNLSQEDLAGKIGVSRQSVAKWESGQAYPDIGNLISLSGLFQVSIDALLRPDDDCSPGVGIPDASRAGALEGFLCRAKKATYAGRGAEAAPSRPVSHDLHYAEGEYAYIDTYLGGEKFAGEEAVWRLGAPIWSMNYCGRILCEGFSSDFLKAALSRVSGDCPFRGPAIYRDEDYSYHCAVNGDIRWFQGFEEIFLRDQRVYECRFHGGEIK